MAVGDSVSRTGLHAIAAKDAAIIVNVVDLSVAFGATKSGFGGVFCCFDIDTVCRACGCTEETGDALLKAVFIALKNMSSTKTLLKLGRSVGIFFCDGRVQHLFEGDAH